MSPGEIIVVVVVGLVVIGWIAMTVFRGASKEVDRQGAMARQRSREREPEQR